MLGITVADAVLIGTLVVSLLAAWRGTRAGDAAKKSLPPDPPMAMIGGAIVDSLTLRDLVEAVRALTAMIHEGIEARERRERDRLADVLEEVKERLR